MPSQSDDEAEVFEITEEELHEIVNTKLAALADHDPNWRTKLRRCCLHCADVDYIAMKHLESLDVATWMLYGGKHGYRDYIEKEV